MTAMVEQRQKCQTVDRRVVRVGGTITAKDARDVIMRRYQQDAEKGDKGASQRKANAQEPPPGTFVQW
ncbi:hypothetical protein K469DRAFT_709617 [Zopfia rhizophila CBS 207.26]|uniref:Uncharacterized protein n=1 Tax=Zopfia rhizophila CBS 207.26 TaxID=1314779 RepID=A0A6A6ES27_9PEZI|nr:hypothetical protein K469DRAFT_709617 [Zopfia rhizophila CBS 207.26]